MRKFAFFTAFFIFLVSLTWGQTTYTWVGGNGVWDDPANWNDGNWPAGYYPGDNVSDDIVVIQNGTVTLNRSLWVKELRIGNNGRLITLFSLGIDDDMIISGNGVLDVQDPLVEVLRDVIINDNGRIDLNGPFVPQAYDYTLIVGNGFGRIFINDNGVLNISNNHMRSGVIHMESDSRIVVNCLYGQRVDCELDPSNGGTIEFNSNGLSELGNFDVFYNLEITSGQYVSNHTYVRVINNLTITGGSLEMEPTSHLFVGGNIDIIPGALTELWLLTLFGDGQQDISFGSHITIGSLNKRNYTIGLIQYNGTGTAIFHNALTVTEITIYGTEFSGGNVTVNAGILNMGNNNLFADGLITASGTSVILGSGNFSTNTINNNGTVSLAGTASQHLPLSVDGTVIFTGSGTNLAGAVNFYNLRLTGAGPVTINNPITVNGTAEINGTVIFANGVTQNISVLNLNSSAVLRSVTTGVSRWNLIAGAVHTVPAPVMPVISDCASSAYLGFVHNTNAVNGGNNIRVFSRETYTWNGGTSTVWSLDGNWTPCLPPPADNTAIIIIPVTARYPVLDDNVSCGALTVNAGAELDLLGFNLTVTLLDNSGVISLQGTQSISILGYPLGATYPGGTIRYHGNAVSPWRFGGAYTNLIVDSGLTMGAVGSALTVSGNANINSNISAASVTVHGTAVINANITSTGNQSYAVMDLGTVQRTLTSSGGNVIASGNVTGTSGVIINASQGITMTNSSLGVSLGGAVSLNNNQTGVAPANAVNFHTTQNAAVSGINNAGVFSVTANNLTVSGISAVRAVLSANTVTLNGSLNVSSNGTGAANHASNDAAIYIFAETLAGTAAMTPGTNGEACVFLGLSSAYTGAVGGNRIHYHTKPGKHLVYGRNAVDPSSYTFANINGSGAIAAGSYVFIPSDLTAALNYYTSGSDNIYLIDVGNTSTAGTVNFSAGGHVEIRGSYISSYALNLRGTEVRLNNNQANTSPAALELSSFNLTSPSAMPLVLYGGTGANFAAVKAAHINLGTVNGSAPGTNNLRLDVSGANTNTLSLGAVGASVALGDIQVVSGNNAAGAVSFTGAVTANSYTQTGTGSSVFSGNQTYSGDFSFSGAALNINAPLIAANARIANSGVFTLASGANIQLEDVFEQANNGGAGSSNLAANIVSTAAAGNISFANQVTLATAVNLNAGTGTVILGSTVSSAPAGVNNLTITGNASLNGSVNAIGALNVTGNAGFSTANFSASSVTVSGTGTINVNINTSGIQSYAAMVLGTVQRTLTSANSSVTVTGNVTGTSGVIINASQGITITNSGAGVALSGAVSLNNNQTGAAPANDVNFNALGNVTISGINNAGAFNVTANGMTVNGITANAHVVSLNSSTAVTQNAAGSAAIICSALTLSGSANFTLNNAANNITALDTGAAVPVNLSYSNSGAFSIGANGLSASAGISLTTNAAGATITGTGASSAGSITTPSLTVNSSGVVNLINAINSVGALQITGAAGTVNFTNFNQSLSIAGISGVGGSDVTVAVMGTGNLTVGGTVNSVGVLLLNSASGSIIVNGNINCVRLSMITLADVTVNTGFAVTVTSSGDCGPNSAIYVEADNFSAPGTSGVISPGAVPGQLCLMIIGTPNIGNGRINTSRYHIHPRNHGHLIYGRGAAPTNGMIPDGNGNYLDNTIIGREYVFINSEQPNLPLIYHVEESRNIYLIDVGHNNLYANPRNVTFLIEGAAGVSRTGWIEIRGEYTSSALTLIAGSGGVRLLDADVIVTSGNFDTNGSRLTLGANSAATTNEKIKASNIIMNNGIYGAVTAINHLTLDAVGNITFTGTAGTNAVHLGSVSVQNGTAAFNNSVFAVSYNQLAGSAVFSGTQDYSGGFSFNGSSLTVNNAMNVGGTTTVTNSALFSKAAAGGDITATGGFTQAGTGTNSLAAGVTAANAPINFAREIQLAANIGLQSSGGNIFISAVTRDAAARNLAINAAGGAVNLSGNIGTPSAGLGSVSVSGSVINLVNAIQIITGTGNISLNGNIENTAARNISLLAGAGNIIVNGGIGTAVGIGNILITSASDASFSGVINAASFTQSAGTGVTEFNGAQDYSADFSFTGAVLTVNNSLVTNNAITVTNSGNFNIGSSGNISTRTALGTITVTGSVFNNGSITAGPVASPSAGNLSVAINFGGNYTASAPGIITGSGVTTPDIQFKANVVLGDLDLKSNRIVFAGNGIQQFSVAALANPAVDGNILVMSGSEVRMLSGSVIRQSSSKTLELRGENLPIAAAIFDVSEGSWHIGAGGTPLNDFSGINGELMLGSGSKIIAHNINLTGEPAPSLLFKVTNVNYAFISGKGNVNISSNVILDGGGNDHFPALVIEMAGNSRQDLTTDLVLGSLHVRENSQTVLNTNALQEISFRGEVKIFAASAPKGLDAGNLDIVMYSGLKGYRRLNGCMHGGSADDQIYYSRWEVTSVAVPGPAYPMPPFVSRPNMENFVFRQDYGQKVSFKKDPSAPISTPVFFEIAGNTMWQEFVCEEPGAVIQFSRHPNHHTILDNFRITGNPGNYVTITRLTGNGYNFPYEYDPSSMGPPPNAVNVEGTWALPAYYPPMDLKNAGETELKKFWNINLVSSPDPAYRPLEGFSNVRIFFSHAYNQRIPIEANRMHLDVIPYYKPDTKEGYFNFDWIELRKILYSFTEDYNGNGRLDRIRVQTNLSLNGNFSDFDVTIEGYKINRNITGLNGFQNGFQMVSDFTGTGAFDADSFYIYLEEDPDINSGNTPLWRISRNNSLQDALTGTPVGDPDVDINIKPFDTIPPRVAYSLTLPGYAQTYVRMSEPVVSGSVSGDSLIGSNAVETTQPYNFIWYYFPFDHNEQPVTKVKPVVQANLGYLLNWSGTFSVSDLANLKNLYGDTTSSSVNGYFRIDNVFDQGQRAMDWSDHLLDEAFFIFYQPPKYPLNWGYTEYAKVMGNKHLVSEGLSDDEPNAAAASGSVSVADVFMPPNKMLTVEMMTTLADGNGDQVKPSSFASYALSVDDSVYRRVTDALVSIPPGNVNSMNYFVWPVWARHEESLNNDNDIFWGQKPTDTGIIWEFNGTKFLDAFYLEQRGNIIMQTRVNSSLTSSLTGLKLFWSSNIPDKLRFPKEAPVRGRSSGGLWLPGSDLLYYFTPAYKETDINTITPFNASFPLYTYNFGRINSANRVDFIYQMNVSDMFIARLDAPQNTVPENWYRLVRPFSFDIQDIRRQRGGVTILNNVINSSNQESTYIRYHLVRPGRVTIQIYTLDGTLVKSIRRNEQRAAGEYTDPWNGTNNGGRPVARGMYFVRIVAPDIDEIRKIMVVR